MTQLIIEPAALRRQRDASGKFTKGNPLCQAGRPCPRQLYLLAGAHLDVNFYKEEGEISTNGAGWVALAVWVVMAFLLWLSVRGA